MFWQIVFLASLANCFSAFLFWLLVEGGPLVFCQIGSGVNEPSFRNKTFRVIVFHLQNLCIYPINIVFKFHCVNAESR